MQVLQSTFAWLVRGMGGGDEGVQGSGVLGYQGCAGIGVCRDQDMQGSGVFGDQGCAGIRVCRDQGCAGIRAMQGSGHTRIRGMQEMWGTLYISVDTRGQTSNSQKTHQVQRPE